MKSFKLAKLLPVAALVFSVSVPASAAVELYNKDDTTVGIDASFNTFLVKSDISNDGGDRDQSRVKAGFLPNWVGFNFSKTVGDLKMGGRSSFWVSTNDSNKTLTDSTIDVRQFYGTIDGSWGQVMIGKDFSVFNSNNIFQDEILLGYGYSSDALGLVDTNGVSFGNIGTGYTYPLPTSQMRYTSPDMNGIKVQLAILDPSDTSSSFNEARGEEDSPRFEGQVTYAGGPVTAWLGFLTQSSDNATSVDSDAVSYGAKFKSGGFAFHASGYQGDGVGFLVGPADGDGLGVGGLAIFDGTDEIEADGWLIQASYTTGNHRFVLSDGETELETGAGAEILTNENTTGAWFYTINSNLILVTEYTKSEISLGNEENDTLAFGVIVNF